MSKSTKILALAFLSASAATQVLADQTMPNLNQAAETILGQISASQILMAGATQAAATGDVLNPGVMQTAAISDQMQADYNNAIQAVIDANYYGARDLLLDQHDQAMQNLSASVDDLVDATLVLATASTVAQMAEAADTVPEQQASTCTAAMRPTVPRQTSSTSARATPSVWVSKASWQAMASALRTSIAQGTGRE